MSDAVSPIARAPTLGVYRFWRDSGYALGALIADATADALGHGGSEGLAPPNDNLAVAGDMVNFAPSLRGGDFWRFQWLIAISTK